MNEQTHERDLDEFYEAPAITARNLPGQILRIRPVTTPGLAQARRAWQVVYSTRAAFKAPIPASGMILTADDGTEKREPAPVLVYCPKFHGFGGEFAPSQLMAAGREPETQFIAAALEQGWTVAVPDGQGLGLRGVGPAQFLTGHGSAHTILDLIRVARRVPDLAAWEAPAALWGYADGGRAALWAATLQPNYAPELDIRGVVAGAVATDLASIISDIDAGPYSGLALAGLVTLSRSYSHLPVTHILNDDGHRALARAQTMSATEIVSAYRDTPLHRWCNRGDPWRDPMWQYVLSNEALGTLHPNTRVHLYHGSVDALVPTAMGRSLIAGYRALGADVGWSEFDTDHVRTAVAGAPTAIERLGRYLRHPRLVRDPYSNPLTN